MGSKKPLNKVVLEAVLESVDKILYESPKRTWVEADVTLRSGKCVKFGCKAHIKDIANVIDDLVRIRQRQAPGSAARARISDAIQSLRKEHRAAQRKYDANNPPPMEEI